MIYGDLSLIILFIGFTKLNKQIKIKTKKMIDNCSQLDILYVPQVMLWRSMKSRFHRLYMILASYVFLPNYVHISVPECYFHSCGVLYSTYTPLTPRYLFIYSDNFSVLVPLVCQRGVFYFGSTNVQGGYQHDYNSGCCHGKMLSCCAYIARKLGHLDET